MIRGIKAVIIKEARENLRWATLACVISTGVLVAGIYQGLDTGLPLLQKSLLALCMILYPLAGVSLGFLQVYQDSRRGRWQFVTHRPISLNQLFICKIAVGCTLYLLATLLPVLVIFASVSVPGYVPGPVTGEMILPVLAYVVAGLMWYAAGLLIAARPARWFGSRLMPVALPILAMMAFTVFAFTFADAVVIMLPCLALLLIAAWGAFITAEESARLPIVSSVCTGISVSLGWGMSIVMVMTLIGGLIDPFMAHRQEVRQYYQLDQHGELKIVQGSYTSGGETFSGNEVYLNDEQSTSRVRRARSSGFLVADSHARVFDSSAHERWYCVTSSGTVAGYDTRTGKYIGSMGQDGFAPAGRAPKPFDQLQPAAGMTLNNELFSTLVTRHAVFSLDIPARQVRQLFTSPPDDPILGVANLPPAGEQAVLNNGAHVVVTRSRIHFLNRSTEEMSVPLEPALNKYYITVGRTHDGHYVTGSFSGPVGWNPVDVFIYDHDGKLIRQTHTPAEPHHFRDDSEHWWYMAGVLLPNPPAFFMTIFALRWSDGWQQSWILWGELFVVMALYLAIGFTMLRARHATRGRMVLWLMMIACLGLTGILLLLSMWEKPRSLRCTACGKPRLVTEEKCPHCQTVAGLPALEGIEIFAPGAVAMM